LSRASGACEGATTLSGRVSETKPNVNADSVRAGTTREPMPRAIAVSLFLILVAGFVLRMVGIGHGLPYAYNLDESNYYVVKAIRMVNDGLNPHWFVNPPGFTYVLAAAFKVLSGGGRGFYEVYTRNPEPVWLVARTISALLGTLAVGLIYATGARLFSRLAGLFAAAILATGFLPVFYGHLALNDSPLLVPIALALFGAAGILNRGGRRELAIAGIGLGLACATKYTGGMVLPAIVIAIWAAGEDRWRRLAAVLGIGALAFVIANPYSLLDFPAFIDGVGHQSEASSGAGKLGQVGHGGVIYYLGVITWGLGVIPAALAVGGAVRVIREDRTRALLLLVAPGFYLVFMALHSRWFARWGLPMFPFVVLLAGWGACWAVDAVRGWRLRAAVPFAVVLGLIACAQGFAASVHVDRVLTRDDTRSVARKWMTKHIPNGSKIVIEPGVVPAAWLRNLSKGSTGRLHSRRWRVWELWMWDSKGLTFEEYPRVLNTKLLKRYQAAGYCWLITSSTQRGRVEREKQKFRSGTAFYRSLFGSATLKFRASPWSRGAEPVPFSFDDSYNYLPSAYERPGPIISVYKLKDCGN